LLKEVCSKSAGLFQKTGIALFILLVSFSDTSRANVGEAYGFGSRASAVGGAAAAWGFDGFAAYYNPAGVTLLKSEKRAEITLGIIYNQPHFDAIDNVIIENEFIGDSAGPVRGNVSTDDYKATFGTLAGLTLRLAPSLWNLSGGIAAYIPVRHIAYFSTGATYQPEYVLYRARTQRPQFHLAVGVEPLEGLSFGAGAHIGYRLDTAGDVFVQTSSLRPSSMSLAGTMKAQVAPYFGVLFVSKQNSRSGRSSEPSVPGAWSLGTTVRLSGTSDMDMKLNTNAAVLSPLPALPIQFQALSALYYDPLSVELGGSVQYLEHGRVFAQVDYQRWGAFKSPAVTMIPAGGLSMSPSNVPSPNARDIWVPRVGHEWRAGIAILRVGYSYRPSIFKDVPNGAGNLLDPSRDIITAGAGVRFESLLECKMPWHLDFHFAYHSLREQTIQKTSGDESGAGTGNRKVGAPGYLADGYVLGGGVSATFEL